MLASILVATPHAAFGELLRISLEDSGQYQARLVMSGREVRSSASRGSFQLAILDSSLSDEPFVPLCIDLLDLQKGIRLIIIPPENNPNHPSLGGLLPHGYLNRPFYLPDLIDTVTRLLNQNSSDIVETSQASVTIPAWLQEPLTLQGYLEKELPDTQALAGIVGMYGPNPGSGKLRACSGQLAEGAAQEVASVVFRYWNRDEKIDLMRFIRLTADKKDYLIYATQVKGDVVLILVYGTTAPLSQIRPQTKALAQMLAARPPERAALDRKAPDSSPAAANHESAGSNDQIESRASESEWTLPDILDITPDTPMQPVNGPPSEVSSLPPAPAEQPLLPGAAAGENPSIETSSFLSSLPNSLSSDSEEEVENYDGSLDGESINLSALLGSIPNPDAGEEPRNGGWMSDPSSLYPPSIAPGGLDGWRVYGEPEPESEPGDIVHHQTEAAKPTSPENGPAAIRPAIELKLAVEDEIDTLEDTRPHILAALTSLSQLEPASPALSQLNYTCVLIPRLPHHYLTGELAERLANWVQQLCLAFGWRLEGIAIRPEYLQWTVQVSPSISPGNLIRIVRQRTSLHIFSQFMHFNDQNPSGDFWATGYLIVSGAQPPSAQLLRDYIAQTRKRQGIIK